MPTLETRRRTGLPTYTERGMMENRKLAPRITPQTPFPSQRKKPPPHYKFHYDKNLKGWKEIPKPPTAAARWNKAKGALRVVKKNTNTVLNIDVKSLVNATKTHRQMMSDKEMTEELDEESLERALTEASLLGKSFVKQADCSYEGAWKLPASARPAAERQKQFEWDKPRTERKNLVESASKYQALYLQKLLKEKDKQLQLITHHMLKANKETVTLLKELEGYRGKNYDELYKENITLKEQIGRACRENVVLAGQLKQDRNKILQKFRRERTMT